MANGYQRALQDLTREVDELLEFAAAVTRMYSEARLPMSGRVGVAFGAMSPKTQKIVGERMMTQILRERENIKVPPTT